MKLECRIVLRDDVRYLDTSVGLGINDDIEAAINAVTWPIGSSRFTINPILKGNGVKPIKDAFIASLQKNGWSVEKRVGIVDNTTPGKVDAVKYFEDETLFVCEWETGNISSSHRALNKMTMALKENNVSGAALVLPDRQLYKYLTDRIGNVSELKPYFPIWEQSVYEGALAIYVVSFDDTDVNVSPIPKGTDGRARI